MKLLLWIITFLIISQVNAQNESWCITDYMDEIEVEKDPSIIEKRIVLEEFTQKYIRQNYRDDEVLIIPVVFHIVHDYGDENLEKESIEYAISVINKDYNKLNSDLARVIPEFKDIIGDINLEFRLAKIDPDGNCTQGITRTHSMSTYNASNSVKYDVPGWNPAMYLNIWVVNSINSGAAAWSHYPGISASLDGVVTKYNYVGSGHTLSHEIGHYLNLKHPWGGTNDPNIASNCYIDDGVEDTPETIGCAVGSCNLSQSTCGSLDNVQNIMDYSGCDAMFTIGQKDRMRAALHSSISNRKNLWTVDNLIATGTANGFTNGPCNLIPDFGFDQNSGCQGIKVSFFDNSYNSQANEWHWEFEGGSPENSSRKDDVVKYSEPGNYNVLLKVTNDAGQDSILKEEIIQITDTLMGIVLPFVEDFSNPDFPEQVIDESEKWEIYNDKSAGWHSIQIDTNYALVAQNFSLQDGDISQLITPTIVIPDGFTDSKLYFNIAYARRNAETNDELKIYISTDCGESWRLQYLKSSVSLVSNGGDFVLTDFVPTADQWKQESFSINHFENYNFLKIKFECKSGRGNSLYIDDIRIGNIQTGIKEVDLNKHLKIYPNPAKETVTMSLFTNQLGNHIISIYSVSGQLIGSENLDFNSNQIKIQLNEVFPNLKSGMYFISVANKERVLKNRFVIL